MMSITALAFLCLTITITIVNGNQCDCEWNLARNDFFGNQECFAANQQIRENLIVNNSDSTNSTTDPTNLINTICYG